jgi:hypothetical protein
MSLSQEFVLLIGINLLHMYTALVFDDPAEFIPLTRVLLSWYCLQDIVIGISIKCALRT